MKTNKVLLAASLAAAFVGCTNEDFTTVSNNGNGSDVNGKLVDIGLLGITRGGNDAATRAYSPVGNFVWMPESLNDDGSIKDNSNQKIGLCWTGRNTLHPEYGATTSLGENVFTNYEFEHVGWLDEKATVPATDDCSTNGVDNGAFIKNLGNPEAKFEGKLTTGRYNEYYVSDERGEGAKGAYAKTGHKESTGVLDLNKGLFRTRCQSVFEGEYLVYFPYTSEFINGPIIAHQPTSFEVNTEDDVYTNVSKYAFSLGLAEHYEGGIETARLQTRTLSSFALIDLTNTGENNKSVKQVILYSKSKGLLYQAAINTGAAVEKLENLSGENITDGNGYFIQNPEKELKTNAIYANLKDGKKDFGSEEDNSVLVSGKTEEAIRIALPVLPQTVNDLQLILTNRLDQSEVINIGPAEFESNSPKIFSVDLKDITFKNNYVVVDETSLYSVLEKIRSNGDANNENRIQMLNDITLENVCNMSDKDELNSRIFFDKDIRIWSEYAETKLILAPEKRLSIMSLNDEAVLNVDVDVLIKGMDCCGKTVARMSIGGTQAHVCKVNFNGTVTNEGSLALGNNAEKNTEVYVKKLVNQYDEYAEDKNKTENAATLYLVGGQNHGESTITIDELQNAGIVKSIATSIEYYNTVDPVIENEKNDNRNTRVVSTSIGTLNNTGEINLDVRTRMEVTEVMKNADAEALIFINGDGHSNTTDGYLNITASEVTSAGTMDNRGVVNFVKSPLTNTGLFIDRTSGQLGAMEVQNGTRSGAGTVTAKTYAGTEDVYETDLNVEGIYVAQVHTDKRFRFVMTDAVVEKSTVIVEVLANGDNEGGEKITSYPGYYLSYIDPNDKLSTKDVYVKTGGDCRFRTGLEPDEEGNELSKALGDCVTVFEDSKLILPDGIYEAKNLTVNSGAEATTAKEAKLVVNNDFTLEGGFLSSGTFDIENVIVENTGNFDSDGTPNVAENFTTAGTVTFAANTETTINGWFTSTAGSFTREGVDGDTYSRATVNADDLDIQGGKSEGGWPTRF